jgi:hypothetical protein
MQIDAATNQHDGEFCGRNHDTGGTVVQTCDMLTEEKPRNFILNTVGTLNCIASLTVQHKEPSHSFAVVGIDTGFSPENTGFSPKVPDFSPYRISYRIFS